MADFWESGPTSVVAPLQAASYTPLISCDDDPEAMPKAVVVHLLSATMLPRLVQLNRSSISPFAVMTVIDQQGRTVGERATWAPRWATRDPVWNCAHDMRLPPMAYKELKRSLLHVELWDHDGVLPPNPIGQIDVPLLTLLSDSHIPVPIAPSSLCRPEACLSPRAILGRAIPLTQWPRLPHAFLVMSCLGKPAAELAACRMRS